MSRAVRGVAVAALLGLALLGAARQWQWVSRAPGIDFFQFWSVAQAVDEGWVESVYDASARPVMARRSLERAQQGGSELQRAAARFRADEIQAGSSPWLYTVFSAIQTGDYDLDLRVYRGASLALAVGAVALLCALSGAGALPTALGLALFTWLFAPLPMDLADGNVNGVQLALLAGFLWLSRRACGPGPGWSGWSVGAGALLGLAVFFKPNLAPVCVALGLCWCIDRAWPRLLASGAGFALGAVLAVVGSSLFFGGVQHWQSWLALLWNFDGHFDVSVEWGNFAGARLLRDLLGWDLSGLLGLGGCVAMAVALLPGRLPPEPGPASGGERAFRREFLALALGAILPLLATGLAWPHYLLLTVPMLALLGVAPRSATASAAGVDERRLALTALAVVALLAAPFFPAFGVASPYPAAVTQALGCLLLFGLGLAELARPHPRSAATRG